MRVAAGRILEGLNDEQRAAVEAVRGPVCILAGPGSGKTTTITRRIAYQVATGAFPAGAILAVTFTDKAAGEMAIRLERLGVPGIRARTFHAEALAQYRRMTDRQEEVLPSKVPLLLSLVQGLPPPHRFVSVRDVAAEIEWAKNRRLRPEGYGSAAGSRRGPLPADLMGRVYEGYERRKDRARLVDFEDLLERTIELLAGDARARAEVRGRYRSFTVDEYQDVNLLQQTLLEAWVGEGRELCVVGDDHQSIYGFAGATPRHLLEFPRRHPGCTVVSLTTNYRSTPEILSTANRLVPHLGGTALRLRPARPPGAAPEVREFPTGAAEAAWVVERIRELQAAGTPLEEIAVLYRINARSEGYEARLSAAGIPYRVADSPFLRRPAGRSVLARLRRLGGDGVAAAVERVVRDLGYDEAREMEAEGDEATRLADLGRILRMAAEYPGEGGVAGFAADLVARFSGEGEGRGVNLLTLHRAKGKEYDAVFLPRLEERELPFALAQSDEAVAEERRLFFVGITRARHRLCVSWARLREEERRGQRQPSRFLAEIGSPAAGRPAPKQSPPPAPAARGGGLHDDLRRWRRGLAASGRGPLPGDALLAEIARRRPASFEELRQVPGMTPSLSAPHGVDLLAVVAAHAGASDGSTGRLFEALRRWRKEAAEARGVPAYVVFQDSTLEEIARRRPATVEELLGVRGVGPAKVSEYGSDVLRIVGAPGPDPTAPPAATPPHPGPASGQADAGREGHPNAWARWTAEQEDLLRTLHGEGQSVGEIARKLGRKPGGVVSRLRRLGLVE